MPPADAGDGRDNWVEIVIAVVLSAGALMTSWATYQAALWDGEQAANYSRANALRVVSTRVRLEADSRQAVEIALFSSWLEAQAGGNRDLATFYVDRFPPDLRPAFDAWIAQNPLKTPGAPLSPFALPIYKPGGAIEARKLEAQADATFEAGEEGNRISDLFTQGAAIMASAMFFGGIGQVFRIRPVRLALLAVAVVTCALGVIRIVTLPTLQPG